jgi:hypothetical protein
MHLNWWIDVQPARWRGCSVRGLRLGAGQCRRQTAQNNAQLSARLETVLGEIRKLSGR